MSEQPNKNMQFIQTHVETTISTLRGGWHNLFVGAGTVAIVSADELNAWVRLAIGIASLGYILWRWRRESKIKK